MKPETTNFLVAADQALSNARRILAISIPDQAARLAYYAQFHAAQALIFERADKVSKTHKGVSKEFHRLAKAETLLPVALATQLTKAYAYKDHADYNSDMAEPITQIVASDAILTADRFVAAVRQALAVR
jgi:uncharacterized protein (UPF0332 family)